MFYHVKELQYEAKVSRPDPEYAKKLQEVLGGQWGEISVMMQYLMQGFNVRANKKYRDLLLDIGTEEIAHVEILSTLIARLLDGTSLECVEAQENAYKSDPAVAAVLGGMNPQHAIVSGLGAMPSDSVGNRWTADYIISSGNLLADFRANLNAESQGRLQVARLYTISDDPLVKDTLSFLLARDNAHQNQWIEAIHELEQEAQDVVVPTTFPRECQLQAASYDFYNTSRGQADADGPWAQGVAPDGRGTFNYVSQPVPYGGKAKLSPAPKDVYDTPPSY
ncbi:manganese catalase family protein [Halobacillus shinanisalinarum]|uniref:Manganese catalase family protein n=1 Tax=Halobacillus shinanisalinarum TaxID=2932258 RepID=A0ABY4H1K0_9BACI|nr:manganese catalase family protein [Halobacillus shinanisalinarum]UOQ94315.1 manganese catalase family protein [Halobacillus shinanisalinarum]